MRTYSFEKKKFKLNDKRSREQSKSDKKIIHEMRIVLRQGYTVKYFFQSIS